MFGSFFYSTGLLYKVQWLFKIKTAKQGFTPKRSELGTKTVRRDFFSTGAKILNKQEFSVTEEGVSLHAPIFFNCIREYYGRLRNLGTLLPKNSSVLNAMLNITTRFGILPGESVLYDKTLLLNEDFKVSTIFHLCLSNICNKNLSWESYLSMKVTLEHAISETNMKKMSVDSIILNLFDVDPTILPKGFLIKTSEIDDYVKATDMIISDIEWIDDCKEYKTYDDYYNYVYQKAIVIIKKVHDSFFYGTHPLERFTPLIIAFKNKIPVMDSLYRGKDDSFCPVPFLIPTEQMVKMQKTLLETEYGLYFDEYDDEED